MAYLEAEEAEIEAAYDTQGQDCRLLCIKYSSSLQLSTSGEGVSTAQVRPLRKPRVPTPTPTLPRPHLPLFEKSNVLVM